MIHLVDDQDLVADALLVEEVVHEGHKDQQLLEALAEGNDERHLVGAPGRVVRARGGGRLVMGARLGLGQGVWFMYLVHGQVSNYSCIEVKQVMLHLTFVILLLLLILNMI